VDYEAAVIDFTYLPLKCRNVVQSSETSLSDKCVEYSNKYQYSILNVISYIHSMCMHILNDQDWTERLYTVTLYFVVTPGAWFLFFLFLLLSPGPYGSNIENHDGSRRCSQFTTYEKLTTDRSVSLVPGKTSLAGPKQRHCKSILICSHLWNQ
jgi:hypothetical protein